MLTEELEQGHPSIGVPVTSGPWMTAENGGTALGRMAGQDSNDPPAGISQAMSLNESSVEEATLIMPRATLIPAFAQGEK